MWSSALLVRKIIKYKGIFNLNKHSVILEQHDKFSVLLSLIYEFTWNDSNLKLDSWILSAISKKKKVAEETDW